MRAPSAAIDPEVGPHQRRPQILDRAVDVDAQPRSLDAVILSSTSSTTIRSSASSARRRPA